MWVRRMVVVGREGGGLLWDRVLPVGVPRSVPQKFVNNIILFSEYNVCHRLYFVSYREDYLLVSGFGVGRDVHNIFDFYINSLPWLKSIIDDFEKEVDDFIAQQKRSRVILPGYHQEFSPPTPGLLIPSFMAQGREDVLLTPREAECLFLRSQGRSSKEAARYLNLSPRTVEKNFENIRVKLSGISDNTLQDFMLSLKCFAMGALSK